MKKRVTKAIALAAIMMGMTTATYAQDGLTLRLGAGLPMGTYAQGSATDLATSVATSESGAAAVGFGAGIKYQHGMGHGLGLFASADLFLNTLNGDIREAKGDNVTLPTYLNVPLMVGANYTLLHVGGAQLWVEAGAGLNLRHITASKASAAVGTLASGDTETTYALATSFGWQAGVGATLGSLSLGIHYYALGAAPVSGESTSSYDLGGLVSGTTESVAFTAGTLSPSMLLLRLGYTF